MSNYNSTVYHPSGKTKIVHSLQEEQKALEEGWADTPAAFGLEAVIVGEAMVFKKSESAPESPKPKKSKEA